MNSTLRRQRLGLTGLAGLAGVTLLAVLAPHAMAATVRFSPSRVSQGGQVSVRVKTRGSVRKVFLGGKRAHRSGDVKLGQIGAKATRANLQVPGSTRPGKYFVIACAGQKCSGSKKKLTVTAKSGKYSYLLHYTHTDTGSHFEHEARTTFTGDTTFKQNFALKSKIKLKGNADAKPATGAGPIDYTEASYLYEQVGDFSSQAGQVGSPYSCPGSSTSTLKSTTPGTARVLGLTVKGQKVSLDFAPGPIFQPGAVPSETLEGVSISTRICPPRYVSTNTDNIFLGIFGNFYEQHQELVFAGPGGVPETHAHLTKGWKVSRSKQRGFATLTVTGSLDPITSYTDRFVLDRVPK